MEPDIASPRTTSVSFPQGFAPWLTIPSIGFHISLEMEDVLRLPKSTSDLSKGVHRLFLRQSLSLQTSGKVGGKKIFWQKNDAFTIESYLIVWQIHLQVYSFRESFQRSIYLYTGGEIISVAPYKGHAWNMSHTKCFDPLRKSFNGLHRHDLRQVHSALSRPSLQWCHFLRSVWWKLGLTRPTIRGKNKQVETCFNILNCFLHQLGVTNKRNRLFAEEMYQIIQASTWQQKTFQLTTFTQLHLE